MITLKKKIIINPAMIFLANKHQLQKRRQQLVPVEI
jgi:hypothetical protein